jgi:hypothetical protein
MTLYVQSSRNEINIRLLLFVKYITGLRHNIVVSDEMRTYVKCRGFKLDVQYSIFLFRHAHHLYKSYIIQQQTFIFWLFCKNLVIFVARLYGMARPQVAKKDGHHVRTAALCA